MNFYLYWNGSWGFPASNIVDTSGSPSGGKVDRVMKLTTYLHLALSFTSRSPDNIVVNVL